MKIKSYILAALTLTMLCNFTAKADTTKLLEADGWTKITTLPSASDIANNYYVFVDNTNDLMLGIGKGVHQDTKWYSLGVYYQTSVEPTSVDINGKVWIVETSGSGFSLRNLEYSAQPMMTEWNAAWKFDTNDVYLPDGNWTVTLWAYADGSWTIQNGKYPTSGYLGPWDNSIVNGAECAANKTGSDIGHFQIYAISRTQFKQNLLDNASETTPVDLTPWYVTNATFDANNGDGWESTFSANSSSWWGSHSFGNLGAENYQQVGEVKQTITIPNGKYKVALQGATNKLSENEAYVFATHDGNTQKTYFTQSTVSTTDNTKWNDMQYNLLLMMQNRSYGKVQTPEVTVTTGALTIGYKNEGGWSWDVFDNFKLYCYGLDLSAYQTQLSDLVSECNTFISSAVVPDACEAVISSAITTYNQDYATAKEYSNAIIALTAVLNTYKNNAELKAAYADFNSFKAKVVALTAGKEASDALTTFNTTVSTATSAVGAAITAEAITEQIPNLRSAALTYISSVSGSFDITFLASQNVADWKKKDGSAAGEVTWAVSNRGDWSFAENYEETCATTGIVLYQTVTNLPAGYYQVGMYSMAAYTSGRGFDTEATEGDANRSYAFAGNIDDVGSILRTGIAIPFKTSFDFSELTTLDVNVHLSSAGNLTFGIQKDANGSNWHFAQIASIIYSKNPDLTGLQATRDALVSQANGVLNGVDAALLTTAQKEALQDAIDAGNNANTFDNLNTVTLTTLPNAIQTAKQQIQQVKDNRVLMIAALERFENDYNLADGSDYRRNTMSAEAWTELLNKVNAVSVALDDISLGMEYATRKNALIAQMDATDASLRLFKSYKAMSEGTHALVGGSGADSDMDSDATEQDAITALNTAFVNYALAQDEDFSMAAFLGSNLDFSAAQGNALNTDNSNAIYEISGWEVNYADADTWAVVQNQHSEHPSELYMRKNWGSSATTLEVSKMKMLPIGKYKLTFTWNSSLENMTNRSAYVLGSAKTVIGGETASAQTFEYEFEVTESAKAFDLTFGFQKKNTGNAPAQLVVDYINLTYIPTVITLADATENATTISNNDGKCGKVTISGRTLYKDDTWNTLCLPFDMTAEQVAEQLAPAALMELDTEGTYNDHKTGLDGNVLYLYFKNATAITAGKPYIVKWSSGSNLVNPVFRGVTMFGGSPAGVQSIDNAVTFQGTYAPAALAKDDPTNLYLSADNKLYWPSVDNFKVNAFRAYFRLNGAAPSRIVMNIGDDETTGIESLTSTPSPISERSIYTLSGQRVMNVKKGLFIIGGKKVIR